MSFNYTAQEYDGTKGITDDEIVLSCSAKAEELRLELSEHKWHDPKGSGWYLKDGSGTFQGYIC